LIFKKSHNVLKNQQSLKNDLEFICYLLLFSAIVLRNQI
jgi:hypothetical protein